MSHSCLRRKFRNSSKLFFNDINFLKHSTDFPPPLVFLLQKEWCWTVKNWAHDVPRQTQKRLRAEPQNSWRLFMLSGLSCINTTTCHVHKKYTSRIKGKEFKQIDFFFTLSKVFLNRTNTAIIWIAWTNFPDFKIILCLFFLHTILFFSTSFLQILRIHGLTYSLSFYCIFPYKTQIQSQYSQ